MKRLISFAAAASALALVLSGCANYGQPSASASGSATTAAITDLSGLKGKTLAVQTDTTGQKYAEDHKAEFGYNIKVFDDLPGAVNAVLAGTADATINDNGVLYDFAKQNPTTKVVKEFDTGENYGFNVAKSNTGLLDAVNAALIEAQGRRHLQGDLPEVVRHRRTLGRPHRAGSVRGEAGPGRPDQADGLHPPGVPAVPVPRHRQHHDHRLRC